MNRKMEYNRRTIPDIGQSLEPTKEEKEHGDKITKKILEWKANKARETRDNRERIQMEKRATRDGARKINDQSNLEAWLENQGL